MINGSFMPNSMNNMNMIPNMNPYQQRYDRYMDLQQQQQQQQVKTQSMTNMNFVVVENIEKAKQQIVPYGSTIWMRDSSEPYQYVKSVDNVGTPTFTVLKVEDVTNEMTANKKVEDKNNYVPIEQFNYLSDRVNQLYSILNEQAMPQQVGQIIDVEVKDETKKVTTKNKTNRAVEKVSETNV